MNLYNEKTFSEVVSIFKNERHADSNEKVTFDPSDYDCIIEAKKTGDWSKAHELDFYNNHSGDYCLLLQCINYHSVRLVFIKQNDNIIVYNKDRIFNNDYLKIATINKAKQVFYHNEIIYKEEKREIRLFLMKQC